MGEAAAEWESGVWGVRGSEGHWIANLSCHKGGSCVAAVRAGSAFPVPGSSGMGVYPDGLCSRIWSTISGLQRPQCVSLTLPRILWPAIILKKKKKWNLHNTKLTNSVAFNTFTVLYNHHLYLNSKTFLSFQNKTHTLIFLFPLATTRLCMYGFTFSE